ncbi:MAG: hypothetical protein AAFQ41_00340 [Cyanobacteria bacterium J06623_7]
MIPTQITQGDDIEWSQTLEDYDPSSDTLSCFVRGASALDLTGVANGNQWDFVITSAQSQDLTPGKYKAQFVVYKGGTQRKSLGITDLVICPSFENLTELETRSLDEIELEAVTKAIAKLVSGAVAEYRVGDRMMRYQDLGELTKRQQYLRNRVAIANGRLKPGGRNVGVRFNNY